MSSIAKTMEYTVVLWDEVKFMTYLSHNYDIMLVIIMILRRLNWHTRGIIVMILSQNYEIKLQLGYDTAY